MSNYNKTIYSTIIIAILFVLTQCSDSPTGSGEEISINFPLNKKAVYAIAHYNVSGSNDSLLNLRLSSYIFDSSYVHNDTTYLVGTHETLDPFSYDTPKSGRLLISLTNDWVYYQSSEYSEAGIDFLKPQSIVDVDTTTLPTEKYGHFSVYPRTLIPNITRSIYRPANETDTWGYSDVYREFHIKELEVWNDYYGSDLGYKVIVNHYLFGFETVFDLIIDHHGIVNSQSSTKYYNISNDGTNVDSMVVLWINRRIVDYKDPALITNLSDYLNEVRVKGLKYIND